MPDESLNNSGSSSGEQWGCTVMMVVLIICVTAYFIARLFVA